MAADKSVSHRALLLGALANGETVAHNFLFSDDCISTMKCLEALGVEIERSGESVLIKGRGFEGLREPEAVLDAGNSGTTARLLMGLLAGRKFFTVMTGDESLKRRPMKRVVKPLLEMGAFLDGRNGGERLPVCVRGNDLKGIDLKLDIPSAQVKSAVLIAAVQAAGKTRIENTGFSRDHTERMLSCMGAKVSTGSGWVEVEHADLRGIEVEIPGDFSSAAFLIAAACIVPGSNIRISSLGLNPTRTGFMAVLNSMGSMIMELNYRETGVEPLGDISVGTASLRGVSVDGGRIPAMIDEVPLLAVVGTQAKGITDVSGASELRVKESDRISSICTELKKMNAEIEEKPDGFTVRGPCMLRGANVSSYGDHRIAMALAVAGLVADGETVIDDWDCTRISWPGFEKTIKALSK